MLEGKGIETVFINQKGQIVIVWSNIQKGNIQNRTIWSQTFNMM